MLKSKEIEKLDKEIMELESLVLDAISENELLKIRIKRKELLLKINLNGRRLPATIWKRTLMQS